jgi:hypothetical protein
MQSWRCNACIGINAEVHPDAVERLLHGNGDAQLSRTRRAVEDYDLAGFHALFSSQQKSPVAGVMQFT